MTHTLLLADDSVTIQRVIELTFADEDISVLAVSDGERAIAAAAETPPDILLADIGMPGRSGYEVARHFKDTPALAHIPVLLLAGAFEPVDVDKAREAGCDGVLTKPFEPQEVVRRVKELLGSQEARAVEAAPDATARTDPRPPLEPSEAPASAHTNAELDDYFERLDQALALRAREAASSPQSSSRPVEDVPGASVPVPAAPLVGAFSALLAAEHRAADPRSVDEWLPAPRQTQIDDDDVIDRITSRVLDRLSERVVVREAVADLVSATAERLVREEIERIKSNIK